MTQRNWMPDDLMKKGETLSQFQRRAHEEFREALQNLDAKRADAKNAPNRRAPFAHDELEAAWAYFEDKAVQLARAVTPMIELGR